MVLLSPRSPRNEEMAVRGIICCESGCSFLLPVRLSALRLSREGSPLRDAGQRFMAFCGSGMAAFCGTAGTGRSGFIQTTPGFLLMIILILSMGAAGCSSIPKVETVEERVVRDEAGMKTFEESVQAFQRKDYGMALAFFEVLSEDASDPRLARSALYGLAVTKLTLASTPEEFNDALILWECWKRQVPEGVSGEDPRMLTPFLESVTPPGVSGSSAPKVEKPAKQSANSAIAAYKSLLESKDKEIERAKVRLDAREKEVRRLRQQIDSLEKIHLKYQEKKQGVSSP